MLPLLGNLEKRGDFLKKTGSNLQVADKIVGDGV
jgi:hypothetical protein